MSIELLWPVDREWPVTQRFGEHPEWYKAFKLPGHEGVDFGAPEGAPVYACAAGTVYQASSPPGSAYGLHVRIEHSGFKTIYAHLSRLAVRPGEAVRAGQVVGYVGSTGNSTGPHLHLTLMVNGQQADGYPTGVVDPWPYLVSEVVDRSADPVTIRARVLVDELNIRSGPAVIHKLRGQLHKGEEIEITAVSGLELWGRLPDGRYVALLYNGQPFVEVVGNTPSPPTPLPSGAGERGAGGSSERREA